MATKSFGRRGLAPKDSGASPRAERAAPFNPLSRGEGPADEEVDGGTLFVSHLPILTVGIIVLLMLIFGVERRLAFDEDSSGGLSVQSLIAVGAASYDLIFGAGEFWRGVLAPLLHASVSHFVGNGVALFFIGMRLEPLVGRRWFMAIFFLSAIGGICGSLVGNPHGIVTVGASGAITGLLAALFAISFHPHAARLDQRSMRITALRFGVPALGPLIWGATGHTDYHAHLGGAVTGATVALIIGASWKEHQFRPRFGDLAMAVSVVFVAATLIAIACASRGYATYKSVADDLIPTRERPTGIRIGEQRSALLVARYPRDPFSHIYHAVSLFDTEKAFAAEMELRSAMTLAGADLQGQPTRDIARVLLAQVVASEGRRNEAKALARDICEGTGTGQLRAMAKKSKLCD